MRSSCGPAAANWRGRESLHLLVQLLEQTAVPLREVRFDDRRSAALRVDVIPHPEPEQFEADLALDGLAEQPLREAVAPVGVAEERGEDVRRLPVLRAVLDLQDSHRVLLAAARRPHRGRISQADDGDPRMARSVLTAELWRNDTLMVT